MIDQTVGSGKTMIVLVCTAYMRFLLLTWRFCSTAIVEGAKVKAPKIGTAVVYFYCENAQRNMLKGTDLLASFIKQLLAHLSITGKSWPVQTTGEIRKFFGAKRSEPDFDDLNDIFSSLYTHTPNTIYIVDGLDEFDEREVKKVMRVVRRLFGSQNTGQNGSRILISSRDSIAPTLNMTRSVPGTAHISTSEKIAGDIQLYTEAAIADKMYDRELTNDPALMEEVKQRLLEGASGM